MKLIKASLVGIGQIFLQENGLTGLIIGIAMFFSHWLLGVSCFLGALIGTVVATAFKFPQPQIQQGLYGFNASLAFMCVMFTFGTGNSANPLVWGLGVLAAIIATLIMRFFLARNWVAFTFPFVLTCWFFCWGVAQTHLFGLSQTTPPLPDYTNTLNALSQPFYAWAEVNFGANFITGVLLCVAVAVSSPRAAMWATATAVISALLANALLDISPNELANGIYGFSPILVACAFVGEKWRDALYVMLGTLLAIFIQHAVAQTGLATYTIGFIVASWIVLILKRYAEKWNLSK